MHDIVYNTGIIITKSCITCTGIISSGFVEHAAAERRRVVSQERRRLAGLSAEQAAAGQPGMASAPADTEHSQHSPSRHKQLLVRPHPSSFRRFILAVRIRLILVDVLRF